LRDEIEAFGQRGAQVVAVGPHTQAEVDKFTARNGYPFPVLADPDHVAFDAYDVASKLVSLGQRPAVFVIDRNGVVRFETVGAQQWQIPSNAEVMAVLDRL